ncbi:MAG: DUF2304 family protein [Frankiales bacterium]|nr:DUF2304 family protein [Frankiales bacterium]
MSTSLVGVVASLAVLALTIELLRRRALREKYAVLWLVVSLLGVLFTVFPGLLTSVARRLGFALPANLVFAMAALVLLVVGMQLSLEVGRQEDRSQRLAEELALLRQQLEELRAGSAAPGDVAPDEGLLDAGPEEPRDARPDEDTVGGTGG